MKFETRFIITKGLRLLYTIFPFTYIWNKWFGRLHSAKGINQGLAEGALHGNSGVICTINTGKPVRPWCVEYPKVEIMAATGRS